MRKMKYFWLFIIPAVLLSCTKTVNHEGKTTIAKWKDDKQGAISITFDDGIINQLTVARPILDKYGLKGTFYIITGKVEGSQEGKFIGRPEQEIIAESENIPTNADNLFERASLLAYAGYSEAENNHARAGSLFEQGKVEEAYKLVDETFEKIRNGTIQDTDEVIFHNNVEDTTTWEQYRSYAADGHEIASHTVTHPRLAVLDESNMLYELEQSKDDIEKFLGKEYTFSAECPYGTENERVMEYAMEVYPALRNRMPEPYMEELNRASDKSPTASEKEYVQWQRGPLTNVGMDVMKGWVDTLLGKDNIWLVLVFHGINGIGWEPKTDEELDEYFSYMQKHEDSLWIAPFAEVTKYIRERKSSEVSVTGDNNEVRVKVTTSLDSADYDIPLTLITELPSDWTNVSIRDSSGNNIPFNFRKETDRQFIQYNIRPDGELTITRL